MEFFPRQKLYRRPGWAVILGLTLLLAPAVVAQYARKQTAGKGPRALGLLQLAANGKAHLAPIAIMYDGKFYDASAYKADPVPMALEAGTVYEAERAGVSQGLFTVTGVRELKDNWVAEGKWEPAGSKPKLTKPVVAANPFEEDNDQPPVLRRPGSQNPKPAEPTPPPPPPPISSQSTTPAVTAESSSPPEDSDRPVLRRGKPSDSSEKPEPPVETSPKPATTTPTARSHSAKAGSVQIIPAISDAHGPEPRSYQYDMKPEEEQAFRAKMLAMASAELAASLKENQAETIDSTTRSPRKARKSAPSTSQPSFDDVQLHVFDLSSSNEPTLVLTATAHLPSHPDLPYFITLVARNDIYNELHKAFFSETDSQHLDVTPRLELIDAVDADGDSRGELLFRQTSDAGTTYAIYRVIGDQLYALYQGASGG